MHNLFNEKVISDAKKDLDILIRAALRDELSAISKSLVVSQTELIEYLTRKEAASFLKISLTQLYYLQKKSIIKYYRIGSKVYFKKADLVDSFKLPGVRTKEKGGKPCM